MIVDTMSSTEIEFEVISDLPQIRKVKFVKLEKVRKIAKKSQLYPIKLYSEVISKRNNHWILLFNIKNKREILTTYLCLFHSGHGIYANLIVNFDSERSTFRYPPHFFSRYAQRMKLKLTGVDLIKAFFHSNSNFFLKKQAREGVSTSRMIRIYCSSEEGVSLGVVDKGENSFLMKTFVDKSLCHSDQMELCNDRDYILLNQKNEFLNWYSR
ncbi:MAG: hypothetical protein ACRCZY_05835 [Phocaeicola sp.]